MPDPDLILRGTLALASFTALLMSASFFGTIWPSRGPATQGVIVGLGALEVYVFAGQIKAYNLQIPFDWISWIGMTAYLILITALTWFTTRERRNRRGR